MRMRGAGQRHGRRLDTSPSESLDISSHLGNRELIIGVIHKATRSVHQHDLGISATLDRYIQLAIGLVGKLDTPLTEQEASERVAHKTNAIRQIQHRLVSQQ